MKDRLKQTVAIGLAGLMILSCAAGCGASKQEPEAVQAEEIEQITNAANSLLNTRHSNTEGKDETVYVIADATGNPTQTIVSAWLRNPDGAAELPDSADLSGIETLKGDATYIKDDQGNLIWQADGSDVYYQGTTQKELPVSTSISYQLDGKDTSPEALAGATGHLTITFDYVNHMEVSETIDDKEVTLYQPFTVISGLMLDNDRAENITVTSGKVINTGDQSIVVGMALPGLKASLGLDTLEDKDGNPVDIDLPEQVTIEADVTDFELLTTVTVISDDLLGDLNLDNVETLDDLKEAMDALTDAAGQLRDGTGELYDGVAELSDGTGDLTDGIAQLDDGAGELKSGADTLSQGASSLAGGSQSLSQGAGQLASGAGQLSDGALAVQTV